MNFRELLKKIRKEDIKNFYCSIAFTNTLLIILFISFIYCFSTITTDGYYTNKRNLRTDNYSHDYSSEFREITTELKEIKKDIKDKTDSKPKYYYY